FFFFFFFFFFPFASRCSASRHLLFCVFLFFFVCACVCVCVASIASTVGVSWFLLQAFCSIVDLERGVWELLYCTVLYVICSLFLAFPNYGFNTSLTGE
ncbi:hypothetical protein B0T09DRAFT_342630, partial [Sordaria sp. MPI-SDFR-AT-0083]